MHTAGWAAVGISIAASPAAHARSGVMQFQVAHACVAMQRQARRRRALVVRVASVGEELVREAWSTVVGSCWCPTAAVLLAQVEFRSLSAVVCAALGHSPLLQYFFLAVGLPFAITRLLEGRPGLDGCTQHMDGMRKRTQSDDVAIQSISSIQRQKLAVTAAAA